jgi:hypothetical protein
MPKLELLLRKIYILAALTILIIFSGFAHIKLNKMANRGRKRRAPACLRGDQSGCKRATISTPNEKEGGKDPEIVTKMIIALIVTANLPLNTVTHYMFKAFLYYIIPWYELPSRRTVRKFDL